MAGETALSGGYLFTSAQQQGQDVVCANLATVAGDSGEMAVSGQDDERFEVKSVEGDSETGAQPGRLSHDH